MNNNNYGYETGWNDFAVKIAVWISVYLIIEADGLDDSSLYIDIQDA